MGALAFEMFNTKGQFVMPPPEAIAELDAKTQKRFRAVQVASAEAEAASEATRSAHKSVTQAMRNVETCDAELRAIRGTVTATDAARAWINSQPGRGR